MEKTNKKSNILDTARGRIIQFIDNQGINHKDFLKKTGVKKGFIDKSHQSSGATDVYLSKILDGYPEINPGWLLTGKGPMVLDHNENIANEPAADYKTVAVQEKEPPRVAVLREKITFLEKAVKDKEKIISLQEDRIQKDTLEIKKLNKEILQLKELLERKKNRDYKPVAGNRTLPTESPPKESSVISPEKLQEETTKRIGK